MQPTSHCNRGRVRRRDVASSAPCNPPLPAENHGFPTILPGGGGGFGMLLRLAGSTRFHLRWEAPKWAQHLLVELELSSTPM